MSSAAPARPATLYVYYRIDPAHREALSAAVARLFEVIRRESGVEGRWMQRRDDPQTCMEVYGPVAAVAEFTALLEAQVRRLGIDRFLAAGATRSTEIFVAADRACA